MSNLVQPNQIILGQNKFTEQSKQYTPDAINSALVNKYMKLADAMTTTGKKIPP